MSAPTRRQGTADGQVRRTRSAKPWLLGTLLLAVLALVFLLPFLLQLATTFKTDPQAAASPLSLIPHPFTLASYRQLFGGGSDGVPFPTWLGNSVLVTSVVTVGRVFLDSLAYYALARLRFRGRGLLTVALISVMAVPGWC